MFVCARPERFFHQKLEMSVLFIFGTNHSIMKALILVIATIVFFGTLSANPIESETKHERDSYYEKHAVTESADTRCMMACQRDDCDGDGAICGMCSYNGCGPQSKCTCLDYGTQWVQDIADCLGLSQLTPQIWSGLTLEERNNQCVVRVIEPHLITEDAN